MNEKELRKIFTDHKKEVSDDGFTRRTVSALPERPALLPRWVTGLCVAAALASLWFVFTTAPVTEQLRLLVDSIARLKMPSTFSVAVYVGILTLLGAVGYSLVEAAD